LKRDLRISTSCTNDSLETPKPMNDPQASETASLIYGLAAQLGASLQERGWKITTAESCTGGLIAGAITDIAGSSAWFEKGLVTYSNEVKAELLEVPANVFDEDGAVSQACVESMATGALGRANSELAVAVSGVAGPGGGSVEKPVGLVWIAWALDGRVESERFLFPGDRRQVREQTVVSALHGSIERLQRL